MHNIKIDKDLKASAEESTIEVHHRTDDEFERIAAALRRGNRKERRAAIKFQHGRAEITQAERNKRNARRRVARKSRKRNGGKR